MNETAYPLHWPRTKRRTPANERIWSSPFSVGETKEITEKRWNGTASVDVKVKKTSSKQVSIPAATDRLEKQLDMLGATVVVLSTNLELRLNGQPRASQNNPDDPGAAVWFNLKGKRMVFACDKWGRVADNIAALAAHIRATRSVENFGVGTLEQAFAGYRALEDFSEGIPWRRALGFKDDEQITLDSATKKYREQMMRVHPDMTGEHGPQAAQLNDAIAQARKELSAP